MGNHSIAEAIRNKRKGNHLSQKSLAKLPGISQASLGAIERGEQTPGIRTLIALCDALNLSLDETAGRDRMNPEKLRNAINALKAIILYMQECVLMENLDHM